MKEKTQILHQVGEILLDVEKRNVKHFEVNTPYLSAVVKGTQFRVSVDDKGTNVDVLRGKVEVSNFQTGRFVLVKPGQSAAVKSLNGGKTHQLQITGKGPKAKIQQGPKRNPTLKPLKNKTPKAQVAKKVSKEKVQAKKTLNTRSKKAAAHVVKSRAKAKRRFKIRKAIGVANLNLLKTTKGLSRQKKKGNFRKKSRKQKKNKRITHWAVQSRKITNSAVHKVKHHKSNGNNGNGNGNNGNGNGNNGNGNGNSGNGNGNNGNGNGNNGNGNGNNGNGNGNNGNGNGNNGNGNGNNGNGNGNNGNGNGNNGNGNGNN